MCDILTSHPKCCFTHDKSVILDGVEGDCGTGWPPTVHRSKLHDPTDSGLAVHTLKTTLVLDQHSLVSKAAVPGRLAPVEIGGGWRHQHLLLLLLPDQQGRVPVPQPYKSLRQGLPCQGWAAGTRNQWTIGSQSFSRHVRGGPGNQRGPVRPNSGVGHFQSWLTAHGPADGPT